MIKLQNRIEYYGAWSGRFFSSRASVVEKTQMLCTVNRKLDNGYCKQDFRYYKKKTGEYIFIMMDHDENDDIIDCFPSCSKQFYTFVANEQFFPSFVNGMKKYNEISDEEYDTINTFLKEIKII